MQFKLLLQTSNGITRSDSSTSENIANIAFKSITQNDDGSYTFKNVSNSADSSKVNSTVSSSDLSNTNAIQFEIGDGSGSTATISFTYQDVLDGNATLSNLADKINEAGLNLTASYDADADEFSIVNNDAGSDNTITIKTSKNDSTNSNALGTNTAQFLSAMGLVDNSGSTYSFTTNTTYSTAGAYAQGTIDGTDVTFDSNNQATVDGVTYTATGIGDSTVKIDTAAIKKNTISVTYGELIEGYSFNDLTSAINSLGQGVRATYDSVNDRFSLYNTNSGAGNTVALAMATGDAGAKAAEFFNSLGLTQSTNGTLADSSLTFSEGNVSVAAGTDAKVKIDGVDYTLSENKATVNGVTYDFANATEGAKANIAVTQDKEKIIENVKSFIENYNNLLSDLYKAYDEKPNKNYKPLTDSQREGMKEEQIEKWEEKAKAGMLYHDQTLGKVIDEMRSAVSSKIEGVSGRYDSIFSIGISTTGLKGQLTLDEDKLRAALNEDTESVYNVFAKLDEKDYNDSAKSGIAQRLGDVFNAGMKSIKSVSGTDLSTNDDSDLSKLMRELQTKMSNFKSMMNAFENKLYKRYDAMEVALSTLGVQLNYVTSAFA